MDWFKIAQALFLVAMLMFLYPRVKHAFQNPPEESSTDWSSILVPLIILGIIMALLISFVR